MVGGVATISGWGQVGRAVPDMQSQSQQTWWSTRVPVGVRRDLAVARRCYRFVVRDAQSRVAAVKDSMFIHMPELSIEACNQPTRAEPGAPSLLLLMPSAPLFTPEKPRPAINDFALQ